MGLIGNFFGRLGGNGGPQAQVVAVAPGATGTVATLSRLLGPASTLSILSGNGNLSLSGLGVQAAAALGNGASQSVVVREADGATQRAVEYPVTVTTPATVPAAPTLGSIAAGNAQLSIPFTDAATGGAAITSHNVYRGTTAGGEVLLGNLTGASPFVDTALTNGTTYYYRLSAVNAVGEGASSAEASGTPAATLPGATFTMSQLGKANRVYQRTATTGGGQGKGQGTIPVAINVSAGGAIYARRRAPDGTILQAPWLVASNANIGAQTLLVTGVDAPAMINETTPAAARDGWHYLDLGDGASGWINGTVPVAVGGLDAVCGQSLCAAMLKRIDTGTGATIAASGLAVSDYGRVFACYDNGAVAYVTPGNVAWERPVDGGTYDSVFAVYFLNGRIRQTGVMRGLIGHAVSSSKLASWQGNSSNLATWLAVASAAGGAWEGDLLDHGHAAAINGVPSDMYAAMVRYHFASRDAANAYAGTRTMRLVSSIPNINAASGTVRQMLAVRDGMRQAAAGIGATFVDQQDVALLDGLHQTQVAGALVGGCIARARHYLRAAGAGDAGPVPVAAARIAAATIRVTFSNPGADLVLSGAFASRVRAFSAGSTRSVWPIGAAVRVDATHVDFTLANDPGPGQAIDFYLFSPTAEATNDPSAMMLRDDRTEDGWGYGRGAQGNTAALVVPAITPGAAVNTPPGGNIAPVSTHNLAMTSPSYGASELLAGFGAPTTGGWGNLPAGAGAVPMPSTFGMFFSASSLPATGFAALFSAALGPTTLYLGINSSGRLQGWYYGAAGTTVQLTGTTAIATGKLYHAALVIGPAGGRIYLQNITDNTAGAREAQSAVAPMLIAGEGQIAYRAWITGGNPFAGATFHFAVESAERYTAATYAAPTTPYAGTEAGLVDLYRGADNTSAVLSA